MNGNWLKKTNFLISMSTASVPIIPSDFGPIVFLISLPLRKRATSPAKAELVWMAIGGTAFVDINGIHFDNKFPQIFDRNIFEKKNILFRWFFLFPNQK